VPTDTCATVATAPTFASADCRLDALRGRTSGLQTGISVAADRLQNAASACRAEAQSRAKKELGAVARRLRLWIRHLGRRENGSQRHELATLAREIRRDVRRLRRGQNCPEDAVDQSTM
jgi:hypothetical protein